MLIDSCTAYLLSNEYLSNYSRKQLNDIGEAIKQACRKGHFWVEIDGYADEFIRKELENRGYVVIQHMDQRDGCNYVIKWGKR